MHPSGGSTVVAGGCAAEGDVRPSGEVGWRKEDVPGKPFPVIDRSGVSCPPGLPVRDVMRGQPGGTDVVLVRDRFQQPRSLHVRLDSVKRSDKEAVATLIVLDTVDT